MQQAPLTPHHAHAPLVWPQWMWQGSPALSRPSGGWCGLGTIGGGDGSGGLGTGGGGGGGSHGTGGSGGGHRGGHAAQPPIGSPLASQPKPALHVPSGHSAQPESQLDMQFVRSKPHCSSQLPTPSACSSNCLFSGRWWTCELGSRASCSENDETASQMSNMAAARTSYAALLPPAR